MNSSFCLIHWPGRGRYDICKFRSSTYRPRPDNGSGDSPRPPFLTEFVNQIGECDLVDLIYHLFGGGPGLRIHSHVERSFRLKTKASRSALSSCRLLTPRSASSPSTDAGRWSFSDLCERSVHQTHLRPITCSPGQRLQPDPGRIQRRRILIEPNQMTRCAEAFCDFVNCARPGPPWRRYKSRHA